MCSSDLWLRWLPQLPRSLRPSDPPGMGYIVKYTWLRWLPQLPRSLRSSDPPGMGYIVKYTWLRWLPQLPRSLRPSDPPGMGGGGKIFSGGGAKNQKKYEHRPLKKHFFMCVSPSFLH